MGLSIICASVHEGGFLLRVAVKVDEEHLFAVCGGDQLAQVEDFRVFYGIGSAPLAVEVIA